MVKVRFCLLIAALCACCGLGSSGVTTQKPVVIPADNVIAPIPFIADTKSSSEPTKEIDASAKPTPEITTTQAPAPSTETTSTSTAKPTTTPTTTPDTTTTPVPPTTPAPTPTPAPSPGPVLPPEEHTWSYHNKSSGVTCIVIQFAAQLSVNYSTSVDNVTSLANVKLNIPANASVADGSCELPEQMLVLSWPSNSPAINNTMTLTYAKNDSTKSYGLKSLELELSPEHFPNASFTSVVTLKYGEAWQTPLSTSYRCMPATRLNLTDDSVSGAAGQLTLTKLQEEAFRTVNGTGFSAARECGGDVPDAVPIAVGCALGGLVLVVLVAYLVGRRRSNARGYLSM